MGKLTTYVLIMTGLTLLFYFTGLTSECTNDAFCSGTTPSSQLLDILIRPERISDSSIVNQTTLIFAGIVAVGIFVGLGFALNLESALVGTFAAFLLPLLLFDFLSIYNKVASVSRELAILAFSPIIFLFAITIIEWWRGRD
jgi:hypothetical protein